MYGWGCLPIAFFPFPWFEPIRDLFDGENAFLFILAHHPCRDSVEQTEVILLFSLGVADALKWAEWTMLIQHERWCWGVHRDPCVEGLKERSESFSTRS